MDLEEDILGDNQIEDVRWLCSLSESELDFLMSLKTLVLQRAKVIGHEDLGKKFDLKMLHALGLVLMEYLKGQIKDLSAIPELAKSAASLEVSNLLKSSVGDGMSIDELKAYIVPDRPRERKA